MENVKGSFSHVANQCSTSTLNLSEEDGCFLPFFAERFWRTFHERVSRPELLKQISLGGWINPAEFIYENVLYPRVRLFYVDMAKTGGDRLPMVNTKVLRSLLPPGIIFPLQVAMPPVSAQEVCALVRGTAGIPARGMQRLTANMPDFSWVASAKACE